MREGNCRDKGRPHSSAEAERVWGGEESRHTIMSDWSGNTVAGCRSDFSPLIARHSSGCVYNRTACPAERTHGPHGFRTKACLRVFVSMGRKCHACTIVEGCRGLGHTLRGALPQLM